MKRLPRPIKSDLKSRRFVWDEERAIRWPYYKILREFSTLKQFYPEIDPSRWGWSRWGRSTPMRRSTG